MGLGRAEKGPLGPQRAFFGLSRPLFVLSRPNKDREGSERVPEGFPKGRHPGGCGRHLEAFGAILGSFWRVSGHLGRPFRASRPDIGQNRIFGVGRFSGLQILLRRGAFFSFFLFSLIVFFSKNPKVGRFFVPEKK